MIDEIREKIIEKIRDKKILFEEYEEVTEQLVNSDAETSILFVEKRQEIIEEINDIDAMILELADKTGEKKQVVNAVKNRCGRDKIPEWLTEVFDEAQGLFTIMNRVQNIEPFAVSRIEKLKDEAELQIKRSNDIPKISVYFGQEENENRILISKKYEKV